MRKFRFRWKVPARDSSLFALFAGGYSLIDSYCVLFYIALIAGGYTLIDSYCVQVTAMDMLLYVIHPS